MSEPTEEPKAPETKAQLVQFIKSWIEVDNEMRKLQKENITKNVEQARKRNKWESQRIFDQRERYQSSNFKWYDIVKSL